MSDFDGGVPEGTGQFPLPFTGEFVSKSARDMLESAFANDEPVFIIRAKDAFSVPVMWHYLEQVERHGPTNVTFNKDIRRIIHAMQEWQKANPGRVRYPD